jgi:hypothetical protein
MTDKDANRPIGELLAEYDMQDWTAADCIGPAKRYVSTMPDSQVRCLLHILSEGTPAAEVVDRALEYLRPHLDAGTFAAPSWAVQLASILTGGGGCGTPTDKITTMKESKP